MAKCVLENTGHCAKKKERSLGQGVAKDRYKGRKKKGSGATEVKAANLCSHNLQAVRGVERGGSARGSGTSSPKKGDMWAGHHDKGRERKRWAERQQDR